jgi:hypothetical protein
MKINMKEYNLDSFSEKDVYSWDEIISVIENLEEELQVYKNKEDEEIEQDDEQYDEDRNTFAYSINLERND